MSELEGTEASSSPAAPQFARSFAQSFAAVMLVALATLILVCDALPAVANRVNVEPGSGPAASLHGLLQDYFWPGTVTLHAGLAALWLACGTTRFSLRVLTVILSMSGRAAWAWLLYGVKIPDGTLGEPFIASGLPILGFLIALGVAPYHLGMRIAVASPPGRRKLQLVDLIAWTASIALLMGPVLTFSKALSISVLEDRIRYYSSPAAAWVGLSLISPMIIKEWLRVSRPLYRLIRIASIAAGLFVVCSLLGIGAELLIPDLGIEDMFYQVLHALVPSTIVWCLAVGWALREVGIRLEKRAAARGVNHSAGKDR